MRQTRPLSIADLIHVERMDTENFVGIPYRTARGAVFGGQLLGQTFHAAAHTVDRYPWPTSMQTYFITAPDPSTPIEYTVTVRRDGGRFAWRNVIARQGSKVILEALTAFQSVPTLAASRTIPEGFPGPEDLESPEEMIQRHGEPIEHYFSRIGSGTMDTRFIQGPPPLRLHERHPRPRHQFWVKALHLEQAPHRVVSSCLAYLSDVTMLATPLLASGRLGDGVKDYASSFDHNLRFYTPTTELGWLLFDQQASAIAGTTLEARGTLTTEDGQLVATINQQGLCLIPTQAPSDPSTGSSAN